MQVLESIKIKSSAISVRSIKFSGNDWNRKISRNDCLYVYSIKPSEVWLSLISVWTTVSDCSPDVFEKDEVKSVSVPVGESVTLQTEITEIHESEQTEWKFANSELLIKAEFVVIAKWDKTNDEDLNNEERFEDRLHEQQYWISDHHKHHTWTLRTL